MSMSLHCFEGKKSYDVIGLLISLIGKDYLLVIRRRMKKNDVINYKSANVFSSFNTMYHKICSKIHMFISHWNQYTMSNI